MIRKLVSWYMITVWSAVSLSVYLLAVGFGGAWLIKPPPSTDSLYSQTEWYAIFAILIAPLILAGLRLTYELLQKIGASRARNH